MTLRGIFGVWRATGLDPVRFDFAALGAATADLPGARRRRRAAGRAAVAAVRRRRGASLACDLRQPRLPLVAAN